MVQVINAVGKLCDMGTVPYLNVKVVDGTR